MQREGATFDRYFVTNSLCCPSRASIFTGRYPHSSGVLTNMRRAAGSRAFRPRDTFATSLQGAGYMTALIGEYLNGYRPLAGNVPPGWTELGGRVARPTPTTTTRLLVQQPGKRRRSHATARGPPTT